MEEMYEDRARDRVESNASFIALPSDQLFDELQPSTSQNKRRKTVSRLASEDDSECYYGHYYYSVD